MKGSVALALRMRVSPLVIGLTIMAFATSAPELLVSLQAAIGGHPDIALGNVFGSNIANIGLILGLMALIFTVPAAMKNYNFDWAILMAASIGCYIILRIDNKIAFWDLILSGNNNSTKT